MQTFKDLFEFLRVYNKEDIKFWLDEAWTGKDKQESLLRLFGGLGLIHKINDFNICKGNFNRQTINKINSIRDIFYNEKNNLINLKDKGDSSDLTGISKYNEKHLLLTTSKNLNNQQIGKLDIEKILTNFEDYKKIGFTMTLCLCVRDSNSLKNVFKRTDKTSNKLLELVEKDDTIIIDWNDLNEAFNQFKLFFSFKNLNEILNINNQTLNLKFHQELSVIKTMKMKENDSKNILWGHIQRSGKSYIIGGCIIKDSIKKEKCNYLIITTAPNETIEQQIKVFNYNQFNNFNTIILNGDNKKPKLSKKNIILCSKQFLQGKIDKNKNHLIISWLKNMTFDMRFIDESHNGGTTSLSKKTLNFYGKNSFTVQITATYLKPINDYNIPKNDWILWDLEDIKLCKNINKKESVERLIDKHGYELKKLIKKYSLDNIKKEYSKYPELNILTDEIKPSIIDKIKDITNKNNYGWSIESCFTLKNKIIIDDKGNEIVKYLEEFQNEREVLKIIYKIFGKYKDFDIPDDEYNDNNVFLKRIRKICHNQESRFIGEGKFRTEPMVIMCFLPQKNINKISNALIKLINKNNLLDDYEILSINSKTTKDPKKHIEESRKKAKNIFKKGVIVLSGKQCSLGVSINNCDIVILLNNNKSFDMINQMMFRSMTEGENKKLGFVIDLNIKRAIEISLINYCDLLNKNMHPIESIKYIIEEKLINLNADHWMPTFGNKKIVIEELSKYCYEIYISEPLKALSNNLNKLRYKKIKILYDDQMLLNKYFINSKSKIHNINLITKDNSIKDGIEKKPLKSNCEILKNKEEKNINYMEIFTHLIPLICILTLNNKEILFDKIINSIENNNNILEIFLEQIKSWWGKKIDLKVLKILINIYHNNMDNNETKQLIRIIKELFLKNKNNGKVLGQLIDKYLIPQELEKKTNAEVSTPYDLRQKMLDKIPLNFWKGRKYKNLKTGEIFREYPKVFEPCCGKGGFIVDIIERLMTALEPYIKNGEDRYKKIVEECLYFSDINKTNIFICKLLIDPDNKYNLNYHEGNTLDLNIKEKWKIKGFDAIIGNPPYNAHGNIGTGNTIWQEFTKKSLNNFLVKKGYLLFVHPPGWRKPASIRGKFYGLFELMTKINQMIFLSINDINKGKEVFKCGTRYDWYLIKKIKKKSHTIIIDENNNKTDINMSEFNWLPNSNIELIKKITNNKNKCNIICDFSYSRLDKKIVSKEKTEEFKYPLIYLTPLKGIRYMYSKVNNKGHFNIPKVIIGETGMDNAINDYKGKYGMTQDSFGIIIKNKKEGEKIINAIKTDKFKNLIKKSCSWSNFRIDWRLFKDLNKNFWEEFINE